MGILKEDFINKLEWHGSEFNWGIKYYRGKSIILWDTLRLSMNNNTKNKQE